MLSWLQSIYAPPTPCHVIEEKTMIVSKASPSVKMESVSVHVDDPPSIRGGNAVGALTLKLAEQSQLLNVYTPLHASLDTNKSYTRLSDLVLRQQLSKKSMRGSYQSSQLRHTAYYTKAAPAIKSTSIAANGSVALEYSRTSDSIMTSQSVMSPAMESLSRQSIHGGIAGDGASSVTDSNSEVEPSSAPEASDLKDGDPLKIRSTKHLAPGQFSANENNITATSYLTENTIPTKLQESEVLANEGLSTVEMSYTQATAPVVIAPQPKPSSWMSFFSSSPNSVISHASANDTSSDRLCKTGSKNSDQGDIDTKPVNAQIQKIKTSESIRSSSTLSTPGRPASAPVHTSISSPSSSSITPSQVPMDGPTTPKIVKNRGSSGSLSPPIKKKTRPNVILPPFQSQITLPAEPSEPESNTLFGKALDAINSALSRSDSQVADAAWWKKQMKTKFSRFLQDIKTDPNSFSDKKIVVVGVHGWFPTKLLRSMIGEPTGTSPKFCEQMIAGVKLYFETKHNITLPDNAITSIPLEGEGKVEHRVDQLYNRLINSSNWLDAISSADVILWATHSQGTPVSIMLLHRLLERGHIHVHRQSVCMLAMAGIAHGPFPALKDTLLVKYVEADAARELFEFMDSGSDISQKFRYSLAYVLRGGIKLSLVGSMQDQVVPLYSAVMSAISHPNILRSIYIDGHIYSQDDFLINLISFSLRLRNAGLSDYNLLTHVSDVLAGNIYALEGGHSTVYEDIGVYLTAVEYLFETEPFGKARMETVMSPSRQPSPTLRKQQNTASKESSEYTAPVDAKLSHFKAKAQLNPSYLPWAMRGVCDDPRITKDEILGKELEKLRKLFENWKPTSAKLREIKVRLEPFNDPLE